VMCALELEPGVSFDPLAFGEFLGAQPDLGAKWWPNFVRITDRIPLTGSNKVDKAPLRRVAWATEDPVWVRVGRTSEYVAFTPDLQASLEDEFLEHGRAAYLPAVPSEA